MAQSSLKSIFGTEEVGDYVRKFDFAGDDQGLAVAFAPLYGPLNKDTFRQLRDENQILIAAVAKTMQKIQPNDRSFDSVLAAFMQNPLAQPANDKSVARSDTFLAEATELANFDGSPNSGIVKKVSKQS